MRGTQTARRVGWAVGGCLLFAAAACDAGLDCDWDKVSPSVTESKVASYFLQQLRPVHALRLPMAGNRVVGLHEVWLEKCWRYSCADRHYVSRGVQFMAVLDSGRVLDENHFLTLDGENGLGRFNNQLYLPLKDTTRKAHYRLSLAQTVHGPGRLQVVDSVELVSIP